MKYTIVRLLLESESFYLFIYRMDMLSLRMSEVYVFLETKNAFSITVINHTYEDDKILTCNQ